MKATALDFQPLAAPQGQALDFKRLMQKALDGMRKSVAPAAAKAAVTQAAKPAAARAPAAVRTPTSALSPQPLARLNLVAASKALELTTARGAMNEEAARLQTERFEAQGVVEEKLDARMLDVICRELTIEFGQETGPAKRAALDAVATGAPAPRAASPKAQPSFTVKAAVMVALVDRIEALVKAGRPALAVQVNHPSLERAEIERVGPREIALRLLGKNGPPPADAISLIREELAERGLKLAALTVG